MRTHIMKKSDELVMCGKSFKKKQINTSIPHEGERKRKDNRHIYKQNERVAIKS